MEYSACLHPKEIRNKYTHKLMLIPCGECPACLINKGLKKVSKLEKEAYNWYDKYFFTLTYDEKSCPVATVTDNLLIHPFDLDASSNRFVFISDFLDDNDSKKLISSGSVRLLCKTDISNFIKQLKSYGFDIFVSVVGEYGPTTFRPHYHGVIYCNRIGFTPELKSDRVSALLRASWSSVVRSKQTSSEEFGFINVQKQDGRAASYVAKYMHCNSYVPKVLRKLSAPFQKSTRNVTFDVRLDSTEIFQLLYFPTAKISSSSITERDEPFSTEYDELIGNRLFPKYKGFGRLTIRTAVALFSIVGGQTSLKSFVEYYNNNEYFYIDNVLHQLFDWHDCDADELFNFYYSVRRIIRLSHRFGFSLERYLTVHELFYSKIELEKLSNFYALQEQIASDPLLEMYWINGLYVWNGDYNRLPFPHADEKFTHIRLCPLYKSYERLVLKILSDTTKTKKANEDAEKRGKSRKGLTKFLYK